MRLGLIRAEEWAPLSDENYVRARRAVFAAGGFLSPWTDPDFASAVFDGTTARAGVCAGLFEAITPAVIARLHLKTRLPFEPDYSARFEALDAIFERLSRHCRASGRGLGIDSWHNPEQSLAVRSLEHGSLIRVPLLDRWLLYPMLDAVANLIDGPYERFRLPGEEAGK